MSYFYEKNDIAKPCIVTLFKLGNKLNKYEGDFLLNMATFFLKMATFSKQLLDLRGSKPRSWYSFSPGVPLIAPAIAKNELYWTDSSLPRFKFTSLSSLFIDDIGIF